MKKPCKDCPFLKAKKPYLTPERGAEIAFAAQNPSNRFPCHKTVSHYEDEDGNEIADMSAAKPCAGFVTLQAVYHPDLIPEGFEPAYKQIYSTATEMAVAYQKQYKKRR